MKRLINEPSAAALRYNLNVSGRDCRLMVIDFGGGTLDVSIVECFENIIEIVAIAGDNRLGGDDYAAENRKLGEMMMRVPADAAGEQSVDVTFAYDINGILHVEARASGGDYRETVIVNPKLQLGEEELLKKVEELKTLPYASEGNQEDFLYIAKAERIYAELVGIQREQAARLLDAYRQVLRQGNLIERQKMRKYAHAQIEAWEALLNAELWQR